VERASLDRHDGPTRRSLGFQHWFRGQVELYGIDRPQTLPPTLRKLVIIFLLLVFVPISASAARYFWMGDGRGN